MLDIIELRKSLIKHYKKCSCIGCVVRPSCLSFDKIKEGKKEEYLWFRRDIGSCLKWHRWRLKRNTIIVGYMDDTNSKDPVKTYGRWKEARKVEDKIIKEILLS